MTAPDDWQHDREVGVAANPASPSTLDTTRVDDVRIGAVRPLISPALLLDDLPLAPDLRAHWRAEARRVDAAAGA